MQDALYSDDDVFYARPCHQQYAGYPDGLDAAPYDDPCPPDDPCEDVYIDENTGTKHRLGSWTDPRPVSVAAPSRTIDLAGDPDPCLYHVEVTEEAAGTLLRHASYHLRANSFRAAAGLAEALFTAPCRLPCKGYTDWRQN